MSSLKDWYRYVDSRARSRPEGELPPERDRSGDEPRGGQAPAGGEDPSDPGERVPNPENPGPGAVQEGEEGLDVWSGLFSPPRRQEPKPDTAPLKRSAARLDEVPPDLPFTRTPVDSPPAPQFPRPEVELSIPSFDEFVSPFAPEASSPTLSAGVPAAGAAPPASTGEPLTASAAEPLTRPADPAAGESRPAAEQAPASSIPAAPQEPVSPPGGAAAGAAPPAAGSDTPPVAPLAPESVAAEDASVPTADAAVPETTPAAEEGQVPWRSPFPRPGPGRTVSSGAPSPRPEPIIPRPVGGDLSSTQPGADARPGLIRPPSRPAPGTDAWERERVERLARTFRETLRALEESLTGPQPQPAPEGADLVASPAAEPAPPPVEAARDERAALPERDREVLPATPPAVSTEAPPVAIPEIRREAAPPPAGNLPVEEVVAESPSPSAVEALPVSRSPHLPISPAAPDVLRNIEEAALIRQRLPQHIDMLLRIPTNEVAQNSYKSPFRETREELIRRLLDPQLTLEEAARVLGVCPTTVRRYTNRGMLHCHRTPGNQRRFRMSDVLQFVEQYGDRIDRAAEARQFEEAA